MQGNAAGVRKEQLCFCRKENNRFSRKDKKKPMNETLTVTSTFDHAL
jgi:hypothetical protein